jgi:hypothetical protein
LFEKSFHVPTDVSTLLSYKNHKDAGGSLLPQFLAQLSNKREGMNRPFVIILTLLFLWTGAVFGTSALCCCKMDTSSLIDGSDDGCGSDTEGFFCQRHVCSHSGLQGCWSFCRAKAPLMAGLSDFETLLSDHQIFGFPGTLLHSDKLLQTRWPISGQVCSFQERP